MQSCQDQGRSRPCKGETKCAASTLKLDACQCLPNKCGIDCVSLSSYSLPRASSTASSATSALALSSTPWILLTVVVTAPGWPGSWCNFLPLLPGGGLTAPALVPEGAAWPSGLPGPSAPLLLPSNASAGQQKANQNLQSEIGAGGSKQMQD